MGGNKAKAQGQYEDHLPDVGCAQRGNGIGSAAVVERGIESAQDGSLACSDRGWKCYDWK